MVINGFFICLSTLYLCIVVMVMTTVAEPLPIGCMNRQPPFGEPPRAALRTVSRRSANR